MALTIYIKGRVIQLTRVLLLTCVMAYLAAANLARADEASFDHAVSEYMKGFKQCVDGHAMRGEDIVAAKQKYLEYLKYKNIAVEIDQSILTSDQRSMQKNIRYCERAHSNILRAEAEPVLQSGLDACASAQTLLEQGHLDEAKINIGLYEQQRREATSIAAGILDVYSLAVKVRSCNRLKSRISDAETIFRVQEEESRLAIAEILEANDQCELAKKLATNSKTTDNNIDAIQKSLNLSSKKVQQAKEYTAAFKAVGDNSDRKSSQQINLQLDKVTSCIRDVETGLKKMQVARQQFLDTQDKLKKAEQARKAEKMRSAERIRKAEQERKAEQVMKAEQQVVRKQQRISEDQEKGKEKEEIEKEPGLAVEADNARELLQQELRAVGSQQQQVKSEKASQDKADEVVERMEKARSSFSPRDRRNFKRNK